MSRKVFISAGHSNVKGSDRGAVGNGYVEGLLTIEFRDLLVNELKNIGINAITDPNKNALAQTLHYFKSLVNINAILIDIHFNAGVSSATGTEVFIPEVSNDYERKLGLELLLDMANVMRIKNRGLKKESASARKRLGWMRLIGNNILLEICFISNSKDMLSYHANKLELAKKMAETIKNNL